MMLKFPIRYKVLLILLFLLGLTSFLFYKFIGNFTVNSLKDEIDKRMGSLIQNLASTCEDPLFEGDDLFLAKVMKEIKEKEGLEYAMIVDKNGIIFAHSNLKYFGKRYEEREFKKPNILTKEKEIYLAGKKYIGKVLIGISIDVIKEKIKKLQEIILLITILIFALGFFLTLFITKFITDPIKSLEKGTKEIAKGNYDYRIEKYPKDEIGDLAIAFNEMAKSLKEKEMIKDAFRRYVSHQVAEEIFKNPETYIQSLKGERRKVAVVFADIRGFTPLAEKLPPEDVVQILNNYLTKMTDVVFKYEGTLDKFIGDCIMSVFGAPISHNDDVFRAVKVAWEIQKYIEKENENKEESEKLRVGIGISYGEVVVGNIGSKERLEYTVIGDSVNLAARLESIAKGGEILISSEVYESVKDKVIAEKLPPTKIKGKSKEVSIYKIKDILF
ncbi:MAG: adenylate/guanylate cyclase domain-containing protein [Candidatus Omnitrophica bacterium]|nr:adenylate/guanylate cyclase domain-containing protein [Candidatus Omnitrophota bacterium]